MGLLGNIAGTAASAGIGMLLERREDKRQIRQEQKLQNMQMQGQKEMGKYNQDLAMKMWEATNYDAQRKQMEKAGLNVGLMYKGAGEGGTTQTPTGNVSRGNAPVGGGEIGMALQMGLAKQMQEAQIANIKANTEKTKVDTAKTSGVDTQKASTEINNILQATQNAELQAKIMEFDREIKEIQANVAGKTQEQIVQQMKTATDKLIAETTSAQARGEIDQATKSNVIKGAELANQATTAGITATKAGTAATEAGTEQTKQKTENLKQEQITQELNNQLRKNGLEPGDSAAMRIISRVMQNTGTTLAKMQSKMSEIIKWLKGQNGSQTEERFNELWNQ